MQSAEAMERLIAYIDGHIAEEQTALALADAGALNANIQSTMKQIFADWLDTSGYTLTHEGILFEYYMGKDTFIYVPVVKK